MTQRVGRRVRIIGGPRKELHGKLGKLRVNPPYKSPKDTLVVVEVDGGQTVVLRLDQTKTIKPEKRKKKRSKRG